jgi:hypothetical protein
MKLNRTIAAAATLALAVSLVSVTSASAVATLDQHIDSTGSWQNQTAYSGHRPFQLFTAGVSGTLDKATLVLAHYQYTAEFIVEVHAVSSGLPTDPALATEIVPGLAEENFHTVTVTFTQPPSLVAGTTYALVVVVDGGYNNEEEGAMSYVQWQTESSGQVFATYMLSSDPSVASESGVTAGVTAGARSASLSTAAFDAAAFSHVEQTKTTSSTLSVDDLTGANAGWNVTVSSSVLTWTASSGGPLTGNDLPASALAITTVGAITTVSGTTWDGSTDSGSLDSPVKVLSTSGGNGSYTAPLTLTLTIPGQASVGTYAGTLTTTISAAP